ncbi:hypothetical protein Nepgr_007104 [Nepenthes gracilis]|uniref:Uncharacterized protein n=1 Tax=Nepenthes gracilis TaxID=150966 RepID=A0AAD3XI16_NEPGR|nr:hypothetical protein Nepgr_007104 [Nepenthes gracilis]
MLCYPISILILEKVQIAVLDEQKMETGENTHAKAKPIDADTSEPTLKNSCHDRKLKIDICPRNKVRQQSDMKQTCISAYSSDSGDSAKAYFPGF